MPVFQNKKGVNLLRIFTLNVNTCCYRECICKFGCDKEVISHAGKNPSFGKRGIFRSQPISCPQAGNGF